MTRFSLILNDSNTAMPSYVNIGAYVGGGTMVDTWVTVGSCAQIGKNVHLSGGVGIGGVLEPRATYEPCRATALGTTRTPASAKSSGV
jgi:2,3,4,5-tetrahydropyridine-2-carboxylate N-succinyltransferase